MRAKIKIDRMQKLFEIAEGQHGFFTAKQASKAGYQETNHPYHVKAGNWVKEGRGIYRLTHFPFAERWDLMLWYLWSRNRQDIPLGVYSHDTAFSLFELSDLNPAKLHMTVPPDFRRGLPTPKILILFHSVLEPKDITIKFGVKVTKPLRTVIDLIESNYTDEVFIKQGLDEGLRQGLILRDDLKKVKASPRVLEILRELLKEVA